jgi:hypothetical protein
MRRILHCGQLIDRFDACLSNVQRGRVARVILNDIPRETNERAQIHFAISISRRELAGKWTENGPCESAADAIPALTRRSRFNSAS